jgi:hypothetical protein
MLSLIRGRRHTKPSAPIVSFADVDEAINALARIEGLSFAFEVLAQHGEKNELSELAATPILKGAQRHSLLGTELSHPHPTLAIAGDDLPPLRGTTLRVAIGVYLYDCFLLVESDRKTRAPFGEPSLFSLFSRSEERTPSNHRLL